MHTITRHIIGIHNDDPVSIFNLPDIINHCQDRSYLRKAGVLTYDESLRGSYTIDAKLEMNEDEIAEIAFGDIEGFRSIDLLNLTLRYDKTLVYTEGDFFATHTDHSESDPHAGTFLIFPPKSISPYAGGILKIDDNEIIADDKEWTCTFIPLGTKHSVTKVESGSRIVFKYKVFSYKLRTLTEIIPPPPTYDDEQLCDGAFYDNNSESSSDTPMGFDLFD